MEDTEKLKNNPNLGGKRPGAGRKKGGMNQSTIEKKIAEQEMKERILKGLHHILDSQLALAQGCSFLYVIKTIRIGSKVKKKKPVLVTDRDTIEKYLGGELNNYGDDEYYFITTQRPDNKAIDSLLDRVFGKARQNIGLDGGEDNKPIAILSNVLRNDSDGKDSQT